MAETQVVIPDSKTVVITSENSAQFYAKKLDLAPEPPPIENPPIEAKEVKEETPQEEEIKEEKPKEIKKTAKGNVPVSERIATYAQQRREAEARAAAAEAKLAELEAKNKPTIVESPDGKPDPAKYTDAFKYAEDLAKWTTENALKERDKVERETREKQRIEQTAKVWKEKQDKVKTELPDYEETILNSPVVVSNEIRDAILDSDIGPKLLYHFAQNPEEAEKLSQMTTVRALRELGKIEAKLETPVKVETKPEIKAEVSKAPEPITPINGGKGAVEVPINSKGEFTGDYQTWKQLRKAGKIH